MVKSHQGGFTLIEVMVAVFVLTIGVLAAFNVVQNITIYSRTTSSRLTAIYLAQEGIELVRNQRDTNWLEDMYLPGSVFWNSSMPPLGCATSSILGKFDRTCTSTIGPPEKMEVSVGVSWQERGTSHSVTSTTELYNWLLAP